jgi:hypothetical protein
MSLSFASTFGGQCPSGFSNSAGVRDTSCRSRDTPTPGARVHEPSSRSTRSIQTTRAGRLPAAALPGSNGVMILICYDGSADAQAAIDHAGLERSPATAESITPKPTPAVT